ncbi:MAG: TPR end-of-group domain-containing protein [Planctomycetota bacterium]
MRTFYSSLFAVLSCLLAAVLLAPVAGTLRAGDAPAVTPAATPNDDAVEKKKAEYMDLEQQVYHDFSHKDYAAAAEKCKKQSQLFPDQFGPYYNLACADARLGSKDQALADLAKAVQLGYNDPDHMQADADLASIRDDKQFPTLKTKAADNAKKNPPPVTGGGIDRGPDIPGLRSVEDLPEGGLRYRLLIDPKADEKNPAQVVIWLHPSGGSMNSVVETELASEFAKRGYALLVVTQKQWNYWDGKEAEQLLDKTWPAVLKVKGVAQEKPILMGFSAGGQLALEVWAQNPTGFAGLILDSAYPFDMEAYQHRQIKQMALPAGDASKKTPFLVLVGTLDPAKAMWEQAQDTWHEAGVPLIVDYVKNGRHQWLVGPSQKTELLQWLEDVKAKKLPGQWTAEQIQAAKTKTAQAAAAAKRADQAKTAQEKKPAGREDDGLGVEDDNTPKAATPPTPAPPTPAAPAATGGGDRTY